MKRDPVTGSSTVVSMGWEDGKLEVEFTGGRVYLYDQTPLDTFQKIRISQSVGKAVHAELIAKGNKGEKIYDPNQREQT